MLGFTRQYSAEITGAHRGCGHGPELIGGLMFPIALIAEKEEGLVASVIDFRNPYRPSDGRAEIVLAVIWDAAGDRCRCS